MHRRAGADQAFSIESRVPITQTVAGNAFSGVKIKGIEPLNRDDPVHVEDDIRCLIATAAFGDAAFEIRWLLNRRLDTDLR